jgi:hypothetical protein
LWTGANKHIRFGFGYWYWSLSWPPGFGREPRPCSDVICTCVDAYILCSTLTSCEVKKRNCHVGPVENGH